MDKCPDCQAIIVWQGSKTWTGRYGSVKKYLHRLKGTSLKPLTDYEREFVKFFGSFGEFVSEQQAKDVRWLQAQKPRAMLVEQIKWGVQNKRAWQQVVAAGKNPACLNRHNARRKGGINREGEWSEEELEKARQEALVTYDEMEAAGGQEAWTKQLLGEKV